MNILSRCLLKVHGIWTAKMRNGSVWLLLAHQQQPALVKKTSSSTQNKCNTECCTIFSITDISVSVSFSNLAVNRFLF